jgi:pimeloyl-ACP methyl ester carboxylesterase
VLLVHGVGCPVVTSSRSRAELARARAVHVPDLPGFGLSEHPPFRPGLAWLGEALVAVQARKRFGTVDPDRRSALRACLAIFSAVS